MSNFNELDCILLNVAEYRKDHDEKWLITIECHAKELIRQRDKPRKVRLPKRTVVSVVHVAGRCMEMNTHEPTYTHSEVLAMLREAGVEIENENEKETK